MQLTRIEIDREFLRRCSDVDCAIPKILLDISEVLVPRALIGLVVGGDIIRFELRSEWMRRPGVQFEIDKALLKFAGEKMLLGGIQTSC